MGLCRGSQKTTVREQLKTEQNIAVDESEYSDVQPVYFINFSNIKLTHHHRATQFEVT